MLSNWIEGWRGSMRAWRAQPAFTLGVVATLALSLGAVIAVAALIHAVLLAPLPLPAGESIVAVHRVAQREASISLPNVIELRERLPSLAAMSALAPGYGLDRTDGEQPERVQGALIESQYFAVVGVAPLLGRSWDASGDQIGAAVEVLLAEHYWRARFDADPAVLGRVLQLSGVPSRVIGVLPDSADVYEAGTQVWAPFAPFAPWAPISPGANAFEVVARLREGVSAAQAAAEMRSVSGSWAQANGYEGKQLELSEWVAFATAEVRSGLWLLLTAVLAVMLLAIANLASLTMVRTIRREGELALRAALGATRNDIKRQLLAEGLALALVGSVLGGALAYAGFRAFQWASASQLPRLAQAEFEPVLYLIGVALGALAALIYSGLPLLRLRLSMATQRQRGVSLSQSQGRSLNLLVAVEIALAASLLGAAGLLLKSFVGLLDVPLGFKPQSMVSAEVLLPENRYVDMPMQSQALQRMVQALAAEPGVRHAALVVGPPLSNSQRIGHTLLVDGRELDNANTRFRPFIGDYFPAAGIPLRGGRLPTRADEEGAQPLAWVNEAFVRRYLDGMDPLSARIALKPGEPSASSEGQGPRWMQIAGIVADVRGGDLREPEGPVMYTPYLQREANWIRFATLVARVEGDAGAYRDTLARAVQAGDPLIPLGEYTVMDLRAEQALARDRGMFSLIAGFAVLALLLGLQGVVSVVGFAAEQRRQELALRLALGASRGQALRMLVGLKLRWVALGLIGGALLLATVAPILSGLLYGVSVFDPSSWLGAAVLVLLGAILASLAPGIRILREDLRLS